ncbi:MAG: putative Ig domain-containing protein [Bryobacteraceae bacterium]
MAADPDVTSVTVIGHNFPKGTIPPANVTVTLAPATVGGGPSGSTTANAVTVVSGTTERVSFKVPKSIGVPAATPYQVSIAGTTQAGAAFESSNSAALTVNALVSITTSSLATGTVGIHYSQTLSASGGTGQYTWQVSSGNLPGGLSLNSAAGVISGLPSTAGTLHCVLKVTDSDQSSTSKEFALTIDPALSITTSSPLPTGTVGVNYSQTLRASGGSGQYSWSVSAGALPGGLSLNPATGAITGQPTTAGTPSFTILVTDSDQATATKSFSVTINPALVITTNSPLPTGTVNVNYAQTLSATGGSGQYSWSVSAGALPGGLSLNPATGAITGQPTAAGTPGFTIQVTDSNKVAVTKPFSVTIDPAIAITTTSPLPSGQVSINYSDTLTATGGNGQYTWSVSAGALPNGLSLTASTGALGGLPTAAGSSNFTILVTDTHQATAAQAFSLTINPAATIQSLAPKSANAGVSLHVTITGSNTHFVQGTTQASFGPGVTVTGVTVNSPTSAIAQLTISATAAAGPQTVTVSTGAEQESLTNGFSIAAAIPIINVNTATATPLAPGFSGFDDEYLINGVEYWDPKYIAMVQPLKPGWIRYPSGTPSMGFDWQTAHENLAWIP